MSTYEQYGSGPWVVRVWNRETGYRGKFRFASEGEAKEWCKGNIHRGDDHRIYRTAGTLNDVIGPMG